MSIQAQYASVPKMGAGLALTGDPSRTAPTNFISLITSGANGTRINSVTLQAAGLTVLSVVRLFLYNGTTHFLWQEIAIPVTPNIAGQAAFNASFTPVNAFNWLPIVIPTGWSIRATVNDTQTGAGINVIVGAGDL
ncbi:hypothetical protein [Undibacterium sp.]|uniref:hypothetical protein n=1 Tax=Undibacterium sp. TaxID=1914977 RepID=UPI00374D6610